MTSSNPSSSAFRAAIEEYLQNLPKKSNKRKILVTCITAEKLPTPQDVEQAISQLEKASSAKPATRRVRKCLTPVISALNDYSAILDTLAQADPMPSAVVWGSLKAVVQCSSRYLNLYDTIRQQLNDLSRHIGRLAWYEELFGDSLAMQDILKQSYINLLRFWSRVEKECSHCGKHPSLRTTLPFPALINQVVSAMLRSIISFSTTKLDQILEQLRQDADDVEKLVPIVQERIVRGERENAAEERRLAGVARAELSTFIQEQREDKVQRDLDRKGARQKEVREWLRARNEANIRYQSRNLACREPGTCEWLRDNENFRKWLDGTKTSPVVWLSAAPGMGKSVLCAHTVELIKTMKPESAVAVHYYRFDEQYTALETYRVIAEQLFDQWWDKTQDVPDNLHAQIQSSGSDPDKIKGFIKLLLEHHATTYILLDGIDEECDQQSKWTDALEVIEFFEGLADSRPASVRLWCSSQDRLCVRNKMQNYPTIGMTEESTAKDIAKFLAKALPMLDVDEVDPGTENVILQDLQDKAQGNFLWAHLMVQSLEQADNLDDIIRRVQEGLPLELDRYYERIVQSINVEHRTLACKIFSLVVFAKRPLLLQELSEAVGMTFTRQESNLDSSKEPFKRRLKALCAPLIDVSDDEQETVCTLSHSTVQSFLLKHPRIFLQLRDAPVQPLTVLIIDEAEMALACLKYLSQPRYRDVLARSGNSFITSSGENMAKHHLLSYAAKYWDRHLENLQCSETLFDSVRSFLQSPQFVTCLQIQSLCVEGQFTLWFSHIQMCQGYRRTFPRWFTDSGHSGEKFVTDYNRFVDDWGYLLEQYPGEIDRCLWGTLGPRSFLSGNAGRYDSFMYTDNSLRDSPDESTDKNLRVSCSSWECSRSRPKSPVKSSINVSYKASNWALYESTTQDPQIVGRPLPVAVDPESNILRIGSHIAIGTSDATFLPTHGLAESYVEDVARRGIYVATTTRRHLKMDDMKSNKAQAEESNGLDDTLTKLGEKVEASQAGSRDTTTDTFPSSSARSTSDEGMRKRRGSASSSMTSLDLGSLPSDIEAEYSEDDKTSEDSLLLDSGSDDADESNSAYESWSEAVTDPASDEIQDDDVLNESGFSDSDLGFDEDLKSENDSDDGSIEVDDPEKEAESKTPASEEQDGQEEEKEEDYLKRLVEGSDKGSTSDSDTDGSGYSSDRDTSSEGNRSYADSDSDGESTDSDAAQERLELLVLGKQRLSKSASRLQRGSINIYQLDEQNQASRIFRFSIDLSHILFESRPVFHPSATLVVWPLHRGEILFADFLRKTYFTRTLRPSRPNSCHIFVKCHFSPNGEYLHIAALEARPLEKDKRRSKTKDDDNNDGDARLQLTLQMSTHRLSSRKTARVPPRLVYRTHIPLAPVESIRASRLPTVTWAREHAYFTTSDSQLNVIRIPLFTHRHRSGKISHAENQTTMIAEEEEEEEGASNSQVPVNTIHLPQSAMRRQVFYFPPPSSPGSSEGAQGQIYIGISEDQTRPPVGVLVDEEKDLGGWKDRRGSEGAEGRDVGEDDDDDAVRRARKGKGGSGGMLQGKWEKFDRVADCDIVPYLS
ncbi:MAG: hypothetical protein LQ352_005928 [Teloschistes flavicans]|nr:MAG: hypothetical protein LQ352_005928 [Teloschistes flavicans]